MGICSQGAEWECVDERIAQRKHQVGGGILAKLTTGFLLKVGQDGHTSPGDDDGKGKRGTQSEIQGGQIGRCCLATTLCPALLRPHEL